MSVVGYLDGYIDENNNEYGLTDTVAQGAITAIKDGTTIDSFGDVETALADKADASDVTAIEGKIPSGASSSNKMATASDVASRVDWSSYAKTGVHNIWGVKKWTSYGTTTITITENADSSLSLSAGSVTGSEFIFPNSNEGTFTPAQFEAGKKYIMSYGKTKINGIIMQAYYKATAGSGYTNLFSIEDCEHEFTMPSSFSEIWFRFKIDNNTTISACTLYPMIRFASDIVPDFEAPAMTNQQLTADNAYKKGDVITLGDAIFNGFITSGGTELHIQLPIRTKGDASFTLSDNAVIYIRGAKGYLKDSGSRDISNYTFNTGLANFTSRVTFFGGARMVIKNSDSGVFSNVDNNTPISLQVISGTLTLS